MRNGSLKRDRKQVSGLLQFRWLDFYRCSGGRRDLIRRKYPGDSVQRWLIVEIESPVTFRDLWPMQESGTCPRLILEDFFESNKYGQMDRRTGVICI